MYLTSKLYHVLGCPRNRGYYSSLYGQALALRRSKNTKDLVIKGREGGRAEEEEGREGSRREGKAGGRQAGREEHGGREVGKEAGRGRAWNKKGWRDGWIGRGKFLSSPMLPCFVVLSS